MTAPTTTAEAARSTTAVQRVTFTRVLRGEWIKFRTLRSTVWTVVITAVVMVGLALMMAAIMQVAADTPEMSEGMSQDPGLQAIGLTGTTIVTFGYSFGALAVGVLATLIVTSEYSTGTVRSTFAAVPRRLPVLWAKLVVIVLTTAVVVAVALAIAYVATAPLLEDAGLSVDLSDPEQVRALVGCVLYLATVAAFALAVGTLMRHSAGAIFTIVAIFFVVPLIFSIVVQATDAAWTDWVNKLLPSVAGERVISRGAATDVLLDPWVGYGVLAGYTVVLLVVAAVTLKRRDA
ncbi:ABC transporter permease subunit [Krasilnikoviella flava]|uniref:ABC-2 type transport system permease protein n=1 Tax=Krasilnikoviella flava TaxID=526729 RepID=A0A1T5ICU5_9MICO|nr:ABC transporter permease subunit [Krasilnikoviella flava]SKC37014.1 ABC-2 type transport system permease protein [Krasilnikoviella flava]